MNYAGARVKFPGNFTINYCSKKIAPEFARLFAGEILIGMSNRRL
jgi:hypothetical protein